MKKYKVPSWLIYGSLILVVAGIASMIYFDITLISIHGRINKGLESIRMCSIGLLILLVISVAHSMCPSYKKNVDYSGKHSIFDFLSWLTSIFLAIGTGFIVYTSLKLFNALLGEKVAGIQFLLHQEDGFVSWPFMAVTLICVIFCVIRIGSMISEIISLCKEFLG